MTPSANRRTSSAFGIPLLVEVESHCLCDSVAVLRWVRHRMHKKISLGEDIVIEPTFKLSGDEVGRMKARHRL